MHAHFGTDVVWGVEDCRPLTARLERDLLAAGQRVIRVPPHLMSRARAFSRAPGKSDPIDALAVARAVLREPDLPVAFHDQASLELKMLVDRREDLVGQRVATINRLLWRVHELDPAQLKPINWHRKKTRHTMGSWLCTQTGLLAELARDELADIDLLSDAIDELSVRIADRVRAVAPTLLALPGCAELTAAKIVSETACVERFKSEAAFARHIARGLVERGFAVISGLATGVDAAAHEATLVAGGRPIGVLGTGITRVYPGTNRVLHERVAAAGAVVSQFLPEHPPDKHTLALRNATMAGLSRASVIVEAGEHSGSRVHARYALACRRPLILIRLRSPSDALSWRLLYLRLPSPITRRRRRAATLDLTRTLTTTVTTVAVPATPSRIFTGDLAWLPLPEYRRAPLRVDVDL